jgi:hypothetical protein
MVSASPFTGGGTGGSVTTAADGTYEISGLRAGNYRVAFHIWNSPYAGEYYNNTADHSSATPVSVVAEATTTGINASLE